jgi:hypothetical protein
MPLVRRGPAAQHHPEGGGVGDATCGRCLPAPGRGQEWRYPPADRDDLVEIWHGTPVAVAAVHGRAGETEAFLGVTSFTQDIRCYRLDLATGTQRELPLVTRPAGTVAQVETRRGQATSADGTPVPYFLVRRAHQPPVPDPAVRVRGAPDRHDLDLPAGLGGGGRGAGGWRTCAVAGSAGGGGTRAGAGTASGRAMRRGHTPLLVAGDLRIRTQNVRNRFYVGAMTDDDTPGNRPLPHRRMAWR